MQSLECFPSYQSKITLRASIMFSGILKTIHPSSTCQSFSIFLIFNVKTHSEQKFIRSQLLYHYQEDLLNYSCPTWNALSLGAVSSKSLKYSSRDSIKFIKCIKIFPYWVGEWIFKTNFYGEIANYYAYLHTAWLYASSNKKQFIYY